MDDDQGIAADLDPLGFLRAVMSGHDPRKQSDIYNTAQAIDADNLGDPPTVEQWEDLLGIISRDHRYRPVTMEQSQKAAMTLAEYEHAKRKSVEISTDGTTVEVPEMTTDELELFEEWFNEQF